VLDVGILRSGGQHVQCGGLAAEAAAADTPRRRDIETSFLVSVTRRIRDITARAERGTARTGESCTGGR